MPNTELRSKELGRPHGDDGRPRWWRAAENRQVFDHPGELHAPANEDPGRRSLVDPGPSVDVVEDRTVRDDESLVCSVKGQRNTYSLARLKVTLCIVE